MSSPRRSFTLATALAVALASSGCVVTTFEGPAEPPRVLIPPPPVSEAPPLEAATAPSDAPPPAEAATILVAHLVVMHQEARRVPANVTRTRQEARLRAEEAQRRAAAGEPFPALVEEYSDEPGAAARGGRLPRFRYEDMVPEFSRAAFALAPGQLSDVVDTPFGYHVILRIE